MFTKEDDKEDVFRLFNSQTEESAVGFYKNSVKLIKNILPYVVEPLILIYNKSSKEGIFLSHFKVAIVKLIFRNGDKQILG